MRLKTSEIRLVQRRFAAVGFYSGKINGKCGLLLDKDVNSALNQHSSALIDEWRIR